MGAGRLAFAYVRWLLLYPLVAGCVCFAIGAASLTAAQAATALLTMFAGAAVGWEAAREDLDDRHTAQWAALGALLTLAFCLVGLGASYEMIYCNNRDCAPLFD